MKLGYLRTGEDLPMGQTNAEIYSAGNMMLTAGIATAAANLIYNLKEGDFSNVAEGLSSAMGYVTSTALIFFGREAQKISLSREKTLKKTLSRLETIINQPPSVN